MQADVNVLPDGHGSEKAVFHHQNKKSGFPFSLRHIGLMRLAGLTCTGLLMSSMASAQSLCVFDPLGTQGDNYSLMKDYALVAKQWGANITLKPYTDELAASEDLKAGRCDSAYLTGIRTRQFNNFTGTIDSAGGVDSDATARVVIRLMANPKLAADMVTSGYEIAGVTALGSAYAIVSDRANNSLIRIMGKRFGVLDYDKAQDLIVQKVGAIPVVVGLETVGQKFNSGQVDAIELPLVAFKPLELSKGIGNKGGIIRYAVAYVTGDVVIHPAKFPDGYGQKSRTWVADQVERQMGNVARIEKSIDPKYWIEIPESDRMGYIKLMREARISLTRSGVYNQKMTGLLKKIRCQLQPGNFECGLKDE